MKNPAEALRMASAGFSSENALKVVDLVRFELTMGAVKVPATGGSTHSGDIAPTSLQPAGGDADHPSLPPNNDRVPVSAVIFDSLGDRNLERPLGLPDHRRHSARLPPFHGHCEPLLMRRNKGSSRAMIRPP